LMVAKCVWGTRSTTLMTCVVRNIQCMQYLTHVIC
jgi:hypothetical protein